MPVMWTFSSSSQSLLKRCLDVAAPAEADNKWVKKFKRKEEKSVENETKKDENNKNNVVEVFDSDLESRESEKQEKSTSDSYEELLENLDTEIELKFDFLQEKCLAYPDFITKLPEKLSTSAIEKICKLLFDKSDVDKQFLDMFYQKFFPTLLKRDNSWFSLDLLVKAEIAHPVAFGKLLPMLLKDIEIPNKVLQEFYQILNEGKKAIFMKKIVETDLTAEEFEHNLFTIHTAYKNCIKNMQTQKSIQNLLVKYSERCSSDKNYGKLLLSFLQEQKNMVTKDIEKLDKAVDMHKTPFKKPCLNVLKEIIEKCKNSN
uniref:Fanconi Anaemia group E protein C-terminal domain-containing protein n=1 Tax=Pectinophora gossypiella TaxID=13191 RepID=A0A1E1W0S0_PECGO